ncbi:L,D-transpeptidase family protein [Clostridium saudiense]|nr:L,D-transpeptidase family protein [Clostridium saudiense]
MRKVKEYIIKKKVLILIVIAAIVVGVSIINVSMAKADKMQRIDIIKNLILEGKYDEAVVEIDELTNKYVPKVDKKFADYRSVLTSYIYINSYDNHIELKGKIDELKKDYYDLLEEDIFRKLNEDILQKEKSINEHLKSEEEKSGLKEKLIESIENDIDKAKVLIDEFKSKYPLEDITELESKYKEKLAEIEKKKEEQAAIEEVDYEKDINNSGQGEENKLGIGSTIAAQNSSQIITVVSNGGSYGELVMWEKDGSGNWIEVDRVAARLGQNGMKYASEVYEMDKCTPTGIYTVTEAFGINGNPGSGVPYRELDGSEYWVDDVDSEYYNTMQFGEPNGRWTSAEKLTDFSGYYNYALVIDYNRWPVVPGKSSAIFLHCDMGIYTYGCVAIPQNNLVNLLTWLNPSSNPVIILDFTYEDIYNNY